MAGFEYLAAAVVHVHAAGQTRIETSDCAHNVDAFEFVSSILLEDRRVLDGVFVGAWGPVGVAGIGVPRRRGIRMIVGDLAVLDHNVMREHAADSFMEAAPDGF